jgi:hypothetical protein
MRKILFTLAAAVSASLAIVPEAHAYYPLGVSKRGGQKHNHAGSFPGVKLVPERTAPTIRAGGSGANYLNALPLKLEDFLGPLPRPR